jgi:transcription elongation factor Elf1
MRPIRRGGAVGLLKKKAEVPTVNCKACGRPFPMPLGDDAVAPELRVAETHQCPYCGESAEYTEIDLVEHN